MPYTISPIGNDQFLDSNGNPLVGGKLFTYLADSSTKVATFKDIGGAASHTNPIVLDASGRPPTAIYLISGNSYKFVLAPSTDTDPPTSPIYTWDDIATVDPATLTAEQWIAGTTPSYASANSFTVAGDMVSIYQVGRRLKLVTTIGTYYGSISASSYGGSVTTVSVVLDTGALDATLNAVSYGVLTAIGSAVPGLKHSGNDITITGMDARTNTVAIPLTVSANTSGTAAAGIGTGITYQAKSGDESPSDIGRTQFVYSDVAAGSEDSYFEILQRVAGAVLTSCWRFVAAGAFKAILTHTNTADRTYYLTNRSTGLGGAQHYDGPSSIGSGSTRTLETFTSATGNLSGIHFYDGDFTLNNGHTLTVPAGAGKLEIHATGTITINGSISAVGAGAVAGGSGGASNSDGSPGNNNTDQAGGGGGGGGAASGNGAAGGGMAYHGLVIQAGGAGGSSTGGSAGTSVTGSSLRTLTAFRDSWGGASGGGGGGGGNGGGTGGRGGGIVVLCAPNVVFGSTGSISVAGAAGSAGTTTPGGIGGGGGGGGGGGALIVITRSFTDNGATLTVSGGAGGAAGGGNIVGYGGGAGAAGVKQIYIYA